MVSKKFNEASQPARLQFIKTVKKDGQVLAIIGDREALGDDGLRAYKNALAAGQAPLAREGIHIMTAAQIEERLKPLKEQGLNDSVASFELALDCIGEKADAASDETRKRVPTALEM